MSETTRTAGSGELASDGRVRSTAWPKESPGCAARCAVARAWPTQATRWPSRSSNCCPR